ncbi:hypothetical protein NIES4074_55020 [Cylindrospermum sp. NIES-4074]|nr:hypothetical protein NIES4074_55020 [Cylindrospermum sp. NIES-4074]
MDVFSIISNEEPDNQTTVAPALKYEIDIRYNNGDLIHALFQNKTEALKFLKTFV